MKSIDSNAHAKEQLHKIKYQKEVVPTVEYKNILGIDYGGKTTGNCALAYIENGRIVSVQIPKTKNPDLEIKKFIQERKIELVFIDAPLSLPIAYMNPKLGNNFHYRQADIETKAMSPMFLGGFTARAIELKSNLEPIIVKETYPKQFLKLFDLNYTEATAKETLKTAVTKTEFNFSIKTNISIKHQFDAILALCSALRYVNGLCTTYGNEREGLIYI
jgi:predicted nuclease with RNAse H fold